MGQGLLIWKIWKTLLKFQIKLNIKQRKKRRSKDMQDYMEMDKVIGNQVRKIEELDVFTSKHVHNVQKITVKMCEKLGIEEEKTRLYANCALLHDIGKIFIPPYVLQKPSKLTEEEFEIMKLHTTKGYELCMAQDNLKKYANVVRYHHENEDGSGYPDRT